MQPRDYQNYSLQCIYDYFGTKQGDPVVAMPTGTGKSVVIAMFVESVFKQFPNQRVVIATHVKELIEQNFSKLKQLWPAAPAGVYSAGLNRREHLYPITFVGIASVAKKADLFGSVDLLLIDEAHLVSPNEGTSYQKFIAQLRVVNPGLKVIGFTATPWRLGQGPIADGKLFTDVCCDMTSVNAFNWLIDQGYLSTLVPRRTETVLDVDGVHMQAGEFVASELQKAVDKAHVTTAAVNEALQLAAYRDHWLVFCAGVEHAVHTTEILQSLGENAVCIHSKMSDEQRRQNYEGWKAGKYRIAVNNNVLTTGVDFPGIDLILMLRPTASPGLWVQMLGRGTRPVYAPGFDLGTQEGRRAAIVAGPKQNCLVLDFAGNTKRLGPINDPVVPRKKGDAKGEAPVKVCEQCGVWNHASVRICSYCGAPFPEVQLKIKPTASSDALVKVDMPIVERFPIDYINYSVHNKVGKPPMLKASYYVGIRMFSEYLCFEHDGWARKKARDWWRARCDVPAPDTTLSALALSDKVRVPSHIDVWVNKLHPEIMGYTFPPEGVAPPPSRAPTSAAPGDGTWDDDIPF